MQQLVRATFPMSSALLEVVTLPRPLPGHTHFAKGRASMQRLLNR